MIKQDVLGSFQKAQHKIRLMEEGITLKKAKLKDVENELLKRLHDKEKVEKGALLVEISITKRRKVAWKTIVQKALGEAFVVEIIKKTPPDKYEHVVVKGWDGGK